MLMFYIEVIESDKNEPNECNVIYRYKLLILFIYIILLLKLTSLFVFWTPNALISEAVRFE